MAGILYVLADASLTLCKIGATGDASRLRERMHSATRAYGVQLFLYAQIATDGDAFFIERGIHRAMREFRFGRQFGLRQDRAPRELFQVSPAWARDAILSAVAADRAVRRGTRFVLGDGFIMYRE
jgi:hypothetical protein